MKHAIQHTVAEIPKETSEKNYLRILDPLLPTTYGDSAELPGENAETPDISERIGDAGVCVDSSPLPQTPSQSQQNTAQYDTPATPFIAKDSRRYAKLSDPKRCGLCGRLFVHRRDRSPTYCCKKCHMNGTHRLNKQMHIYGRNFTERRKNSVHQWVCEKINTGKIIRPSVCERCGSSHKMIQAHHADYLRRNYLVFLCHPCHMNAHVYQQIFDEVDGLARDYKDDSLALAQAYARLSRKAVQS